MNSISANKTESFINWLKNYWSCLLILLAIFGFVDKALYNYPVGIMAILGIYRFLKSPADIWNDSTQRFFLIMFLCLWLPLLISFPDAVNHERAAQTIFPYIRFLFAGIFIIQEVSKDERRLNFIVTAIFLTVTFWTIDASVQFFYGKDLFGYPYDSFQGITGVFYPRNTISHICSILFPFVFIYIYKKQQHRTWLWLSLIPLFFVILVSGRRAAWIMLALSSFGFLAYIYFISLNKKQIIRIFAIIAACISLVLVTTIVFHKPTNERVKITLGLFSNDFQTIDKATAYRLSLWKTAYNIFLSNPINGIGPRGFRYVYYSYSTPDDFWHDESRIYPQTHPHLLILEIMTETGLIGLAGYLILLFMLIKQAWELRNQKTLFPFFLPVIVAVFPLNAHMAFYGSIWSSMIWLLLSIYLANIRLKQVV